MITFLSAVLMLIITGWSGYNLYNHRSAIERTISEGLIMFFVYVGIREVFTWFQ